MTGFTSECPQCERLLTDYISAANEVLESKKQYRMPNETETDGAGVRIDKAKQQRNEARRRFFTHKRLQHGLS